MAINKISATFKARVKDCAHLQASGLSKNQYFQNFHDLEKKIETSSNLFKDYKKFVAPEKVQSLNEVLGVRFWHQFVPKFLTKRYELQLKSRLKFLSEVLEQKSCPYFNPVLKRKGEAVIQAMEKLYTKQGQNFENAPLVADQGLNYQALTCAMTDFEQYCTHHNLSVAELKVAQNFKNICAKIVNPFYSYTCRVNELCGLVRQSSAMSYYLKEEKNQERVKQGKPRREQWSVEQTAQLSISSDSLIGFYLLLINNDNSLFVNEPHLLKDFKKCEAKFLPLFTYFSKSFQTAGKFDLDYAFQVCEANFTKNDMNGELGCSLVNFFAAIIAFEENLNPSLVRVHTPSSSPSAHRPIPSFELEAPNLKI